MMTNKIEAIKILQNEIKQDLTKKQTEMRQYRIKVLSEELKYLQRELKGIYQ